MLRRLHVLRVSIIYGSVKPVIHKIWRCSPEQERIDRLIRAADQSGFTVDYLELVTRGLPVRAEEIVLGNMAMLPRYMKSSDNPNVSHSFRAPLRLMR